MAEILNLRKARKAKTRDEKVARASENRVKFGQPKHERDKRNAEKTASDRHHDGHRRCITEEPDKH